VTYLRASGSPWRIKRRQGVEVSLKWGALMTVEGGMMTRLTNFADWQGALEAAWLSE
jgi:hypothetical protein